MRYLLLLLILPFMGCMTESYKTDFNEHFIPSEITEDNVACGTDEDEDIYQLSEVFFANDEILTFNLDIVYFSNNKGSIEEDFFYKRIQDLNTFMLEAGSGVEVEINEIRQISGPPKEDPKALEYITKVSELIRINSRKKVELLNTYTMNDYKFWNRVYGRPNRLTWYIYFDNSSDLAGIAGGIGATFFATRLLYIDTENRTVEHELSHALGLYHTHQPDRAEEFCNPYTGDKVASTYKSPRLRGLIDENCFLHENWEYLVKQEWYESKNSPALLAEMPEEEIEKLVHNVMSYTKSSCRKGYTDGQILRMRKIIETSQDLRRAIQGLETPVGDVLWNLIES